MSQSALLMVAAIVIEVLLLLLVLLAVAWLRGRGARRRDRLAMRALVGRIRQGGEAREQALDAFLSERFGLEGEALEATRTAMRRAEVELLHRFVAIYGKRDATVAARFDGELYAAVEPYHALSGSPVMEAPATAVDDGELETLRRENKRLSDELKITMETMSRMLNEYSTMFSGGQPVALAGFDIPAPGSAAEPAQADSEVEGPADETWAVADPEGTIGRADVASRGGPVGAGAPDDSDDRGADFGRTGDPVRGDDLAAEIASEGPADASQDQRNADVDAGFDIDDALFAGAPTPPRRDPEVPPDGEDDNIEVLAPDTLPFDETADAAEPSPDKTAAVEQGRPG